MAEMDVASAVAGGTETDQKRHGTHKQQFSKLTERFRELEELGAADTKRFKTLCFTLLSSFEGVRLENEGQIKQYEAKIAYCRAMQESCSMFSNLLVGMMATQVQEAKSAQLPAEPTVPGKLADGTTKMTAEEARAVYCVCGCADEEDAESCDCSCHKGTPCDDERCLVCKSRKAQLAAETSGRRRAPEPAKKAKKVAKKRTRKKTTKKATGKE